MLDINSSNGVVAVRLKSVIKEKGLKQSVIANKAGFTAQEMSDMLNGRRLMRPVDIASIIGVIKEYGIDANYLFGFGKEGD